MSWTIRLLHGEYSVSGARSWEVKEKYSSMPRWGKATKKASRRARIIAVKKIAKKKDIKPMKNADVERKGKKGE